MTSKIQVNFRYSRVLMIVANRIIPNNCSVWSYQTYRDYYRQYYGADENFGLKISDEDFEKISSKILDVLEFSRDF